MGAGGRPENSNDSTLVDRLLRLLTISGVNRGIKR